MKFYSDIGKTVFFGVRHMMVDEIAAAKDKTRVELKDVNDFRKKEELSKRE